MLKIIIFALCILVISGSASAEPMTATISYCDNQAYFQTFVNCIKGRYARVGNQPNAISVREFYARLDELAEAVAGKQISDASAKVEVYRVYRSTIETDNIQEQQRQQQWQRENQRIMDDTQNNMNQIFRGYQDSLRKPAPSTPQIDYKCLNDCTGRGYQYNFCSQKCSY